MTRWSFRDACQYLFARQAGRIKWSLEPTLALLEAIGHPERQFPAIHVGGTNGKGSTCAFLTAALRARGFRVGLYSSPHLVSVRERVAVNGEPMREEAFAEWTAVLEPHIERTGASFFEAMTAIGFADLASRDVDIAVVEVGLGGRLDSTNVITPLVSVVTKIALEHTDYLGPDLASIAREKAGIAKPGVSFVTGEQNPEVRRILIEQAEQLGAHPIVRAGPGIGRAPEGLVLGLRGPHQWANAWVALGALNALPPPFGPVGPWMPPSFAEAYVPGRFDVRGRWIFDVAHNPDGMDVLVAALREFAPPRPLHALVGIRNDKDWPAMLRAVRPAVDRLLLTVAPSVPGHQRWAERDFGDRLPEESTRFEPDFDLALAEIQRGARTVLVTGSFHTVGDAMARLPGFAPIG